MATNPYFNNFSSGSEQGLIEDLIIETIRMHGIDCYYLPRTLGAEDDLLNEDDLPLFDQAVTVEMYLKNVDSFEGEGDLFSKFGIQIRDQMTLSVARKRFANTVASATELTRPREGDILYFPLNNKMFELMHVEHEEIFYQMGALQTYGLKCELLEYTNQRFETGIPEIDALWEGYQTTANTAWDDLEAIDEWADNETIQGEADPIIDFSEADPFSSGGNW